MKTVTLFYLESCPYCQNARRALRELLAEEPDFAAVAIEWVEESREPMRAGTYDYYYVPTAFIGRDKLFEAVPGESFKTCKSNLRAALSAAMG